MTDTYEGPPHLRPIDEAVVKTLHSRIRTLPAPLQVRLELDAFRETRAPWDAMRLANAMHYAKLDPALVRELDTLAQESGGITPRER